MFLITVTGVGIQVKLALQLGTPFQAFHQHLMLMLDGVMPKSDRRIFNSLSSTSAVVDFLHDCYGIGRSCDSGSELADPVTTVNIDSCAEIVNQ